MNIDDAIKADPSLARTTSTDDMGPCYRIMNVRDPEDRKLMGLPPITDADREGWARMDEAKAKWRGIMDAMQEARRGGRLCVMSKGESVWLYDGELYMDFGDDVADSPVIVNFCPVCGKAANEHP